VPLRAAIHLRLGSTGKDEQESTTEFMAMLLVRHVKYHLGELEMQRVIVYVGEVGLLPLLADCETTDLATA
jgi:hypothetical protein